MLLPSGNPFKSQEVLYLQSMTPPTKRFDIFPPDWGMLRRSRCVQIFLETSLTRQCLERRVLNFLQTPDYVLFKKKQNAPRPSGHPPVRGENVRTFRWDLRLQRQKKNSSWHLNGFLDGSNIGSTVLCRGEAHRYTVHLLIAMQGHQTKNKNKTETM